METERQRGSGGKFCSSRTNPSEFKLPSQSRWSCSASLLLVFLLASCSPTITRHEVKQRQASFTSTGQDSGLISTDAKDGFRVNSDWIAIYDSLLAKYGDRLTPPRKAGDRNGIVAEGKTFRISDAVLERELVLNQLRVNGDGP